MPAWGRSRSPVRIESTARQLIPRVAARSSSASHRANGTNARAPRRSCHGWPGSPIVGRLRRADVDGAARFLRRRQARRRQLRRRDSVCARADASRPGFPAAGTPHARSSQRHRARVAPCRSSSGAASPTNPCSTSPSADSWPIPGRGTSRSGECWAIPVPSRRWWATSLRSGSTCGYSATWWSTRILFPDFDDNLLDAFRQEAELFLASTLREDRSVLDLFRADYTFVNERLARHYGIPGIYGSRFRRVPLPRPRRTRRPARKGRDPDHHVLPRSHLAGRAREVAAEQHLRAADTSTAARRRHQPARA